MPGEFAARKLKMNKKAMRWKKVKIQNQILRHVRRKFDPLEGAPQATGIVLEKRSIEQKQPHSGLIKCVRVRLVKNDKQVTAFLPRTGAVNHVSEHDQVTIMGMGGSQGGAVGSHSGIKYQVVKVNNISLEMIRTGRKQKVTKQ